MKKSLVMWLYESYAQGYGSEKNKIEVSSTTARARQQVEQRADDAPWTAKESSVLANQYVRAVEGIAASLGRSRSSVETELRRLGMFGVSNFSAETSDA